MYKIYTFQIWIDWNIPDNKKLTVDDDGATLQILSDTVNNPICLQDHTRKIQRKVRSPPKSKISKPNSKIKSKFSLNFKKKLERENSEEFLTENNESEKDEEEEEKEEKKCTSNFYL